MAKRVVILALPGVWGSSLMGVFDIFAVTNLIASNITKSKTSLFKPLIYSEDGEPIRSSSGQLISVDGKMEEIEKDDLVYLPPSTLAGAREIDQALKENEKFIGWLSANVPRFHLFVTHCSGTFFLAEANLVNDMKVTTAWFLAKTFIKRYPHVALDCEAICIESGNIMCGGATSSYQDLCLRIIERHTDKHFSRLVAKYLMIDNQRKSQSPYALLTDYDISDPVVSEAEQWIRKHLAEEFSVPDIAEAVAVSPRTLIRRIKNCLGESPQSLIQKLRIEKSKLLLETTPLPWNQIVARCGYNDESSFRRLFKRHCNLSPSDYRERFNSAFDSARRLDMKSDQYSKTK